VTDASEPIPTPPPQQQPPPPDASAVIARGHLHPAVLLLRLIDALRQSAVPIVFGVLLQSWVIGGLGALMFVFGLGYAIARYLTLEYTLTGDELRVREGLLERQERRIPLDRIQDLGFESTILRRVLGLTVVLVETASGRGVEARLDSLARGDAEHLREVLLHARSLATAPRAAPSAEAAVAAPREPDPEWVVHKSTTRELLVRGLSDLRLSAFVVTGFAALQFADQLGLAARLAGVAGGVRGFLGRYPPLVVGLVLAALLLAVVFAGVATSVLGNLVTFHGFQVVLRGDVLQRRFGLLTTRHKMLPRARIQRVTVEQTWLRRLLGWAVVKADSAGGSRREGEDTAGGWDVVVPLARLDTTQARLPALLPGIEQETFAWQRGSPRLIARTSLQGVLLAAVTVPIAWLQLGAAAASPLLLLLPLWALLGVLIYRNLGFALGHGFLALQHGVLGRTVAYLPTAKVQAVVVRQGPIAQLLGLAELTVYVAGGSPTRLPDLLLTDARALANAIAERAAIAAAATW
jgi:putative membrane protein